MKPNSITVAGQQVKIKVLQPYRSPGEFACFIEGVRRTADALGYGISFGSDGGIPSEVKLSHVAPTLPPPPPEPVVTIEIPEEMPVMIEDKPVKKVKLRKKAKRAEPDARTQ